MTLFIFILLANFAPERGVGIARTWVWPDGRIDVVVTVRIPPIETREIVRLLAPSRSNSRASLILHTYADSELRSQGLVRWTEVEDER